MISTGVGWSKKKSFPKHETALDSLSVAAHGTLSCIETFLGKQNSLMHA